MEYFSLMKFLILALPLLFLSACQPSKVTISYKLDQPIHLELMHNGYYSTMGGDLEEMGTITQIYMNQDFLESQGRLIMDSKFQIARNKGYHKNSMPEELALQCDHIIQSEQGQVVSISGFNDFVTKVVNMLNIPDKWKFQLRQSNYPNLFDRIAKKRWDINHLLEGTYPTSADITQQLAKEGRLKVQGIKIDSVKTGKLSTIDKRRCLAYTVWYTENQEFPEYLWEQYTYGTETGKAFKSYTPISGKVSSEYTTHIDIKNGVVCREMEKRSIVTSLEEKATGRSEEFFSRVTFERLYTQRKLTEK
jgi:hypothetical protein